MYNTVIKLISLGPSIYTDFNTIVKILHSDYKASTFLYMKMWF